MRTSRLRLVILALLSLLGSIAFFWPFVVPEAIGAFRPLQEQWWGPPLMVIVLTSPLALLLFLELGRGGMGAKAVALIGVLGAAMVALRLPGYVAGFNAIFIVPILAGNAFGPGFGFTVGAIGMFASGLFLGGMGPWLPFQMVAMGWVGLGAGLLPKGSWPVRLTALVIYGVIVGFVFGAVMNLYSWPLNASGTAIDWDPNATGTTNLRHYAAYYLATSLLWDSIRALGLALLVLVLGRPLLGSLDRAARRMHFDVTDTPEHAAPSADHVAEPVG